MTTLPQINSQLQTLLMTTTDTLALEQSYVKRPDRAKFTPSTLVQTLVFGWWAEPDATLEQLAQMALRVGVEVSPQAIEQRFTTKTATLLQAYSYREAERTCHATTRNCEHGLFPHRSAANMTVTVYDTAANRTPSRNNVQRAGGSCDYDTRPLFVLCWWRGIASPNWWCDTTT